MWQGFLKRRSFQEAEILRQLYSSSFPDLYRFSIQCLQYKAKMLEAFVIMQSINMLQGLIPPKVVWIFFLYLRNLMEIILSKSWGYVERRFFDNLEY